MVVVLWGELSSEIRVLKVMSPKLRGSSIEVVSSDREVAEVFKTLLMIPFITVVLRRELVSLRHP